MSNLEPRKYQQEVLRALRKTRKEGAHSALVVMATGLGKTFTSAFDVEEYMSCHEGRALFLCHNNGILAQNMAAFQYVLDGEFSYGLFNGIEKVPDADFVFASFQTMLDHKEEFAPDAFSYIVVDEAHHAPAETFRTVIDYFQPDFLLGMTATPERPDGLELESIFGPITFNLGLIEAIRRGLLVDIDYHLVLDEMAELGSLTVDGEKISMGELNRRLFIPKRDEEIARIISERLAKYPNSSTLIFCRTIEHAENISALLDGSEVVHSKMMSDENKAILDRFRRGDLPIIISVDQLNEGIDVPHADVIVFLRSTASQIVFYQQLGRGLRLHEGKDHATVLDFVGNYKRLETLATMQRELNAPDDFDDGDYLDEDSLEEEPENEHFVLNIEASQFTDRQVNIFDVLGSIDRLTEDWTRETAFSALTKWVAENGRMFKSKDLDAANNGLPCVKKIRELFGSVHEAQLAVNPSYQPRWTEETALVALKEWVAENGRMFKAGDLKSTNGLPNPHKVCELFGSTFEAQLAVNPSYQPRWTKATALAALTEWVAKNGRMFKAEDLKSTNGLPYPQIVIELFGSTFEAQLAVDPSYQPGWTKETTLVALKEWVAKNGRMFKAGDLKSTNGLPGRYKTIELFGSIPEAQLAVNPSYQPRWTKATALVALTEWVAKSGRMFKSRDLNVNSGLPYPQIVRELFGSILEAQLAVDPSYKPRYKPVDYWTKETAFEALKEWVAKNGRMFGKRDLGSANGLPCEKKVSELFGSIPEAQLAVDPSYRSRR